MQLITFPVTLEDSSMLSPKVKHFRFKCESDEPFDYISGQFITIHFKKDGKTLRRSYSLANPPKKDNLIEFAAGYVENGPGTELLFNLKPGDQININGPFGRLLLKEPAPRRYILVATSTGVTPYRAMIPDLSQALAEHPEMKVDILLGVQKREEIIYAKDFTAFAEAFPGQVRFIPCLSRQPADELLSGERAGYVQQEFKALSLNPAEDLVYLCGNPGMIDEAFEYLKEQGFTTKEIVREKYISR